MPDGTSTSGLLERGNVLARLLDGAPDAMAVTDVNGCIMLLNRQAEALFQYSRDSLLGEPIEILVPERFRHAHVAHRARFLASPEPRRMGNRFGLYAARSDGTEFPADISLSPVRLPDGIVVVLAVRDLTEARRRDAAREALIEELEKALSQVRQLSGLLPICAWCRRVRDDHGYWSQLEAYIHEHTTADFSHGICPDCARHVERGRPHEVRARHGISRDLE